MSHASSRLYASDSYCPECMFSWMIEWSICRMLGTVDPLELQEILRQRMQARTKYLCAIHVINLFWIQGALGISGNFPKNIPKKSKLQVKPSWLTFLRDMTNLEAFSNNL